MKYLLIGEKYDRGPGGPLKVKFEAENDAAAKLKMCAMAFAGHPREVQPLITFEEVRNYLLVEIFEEDDDPTLSQDNDPETFTDFVVTEIFEPQNGDGMDYYTSLENLTTDETVWGDDTDFF